MVTNPGTTPPPPPAAPTPGLCRQLDELLFTADGWFCIDARNVRVPGLTPGTLDQALGMVGRGLVATVVGRLRRGVVAVDVDAGGRLGAEAATAVTAWCAARGLWHLQRPSGGGPGRAHILMVPGVHDGDLVDHVAAVRRELGLSGRLLDLRGQVRPLSAPHRRTGPTETPAGLQAALTTLGEVLAPLPGRITSRRLTSSSARSTTTVAGGPAAPLTPLRRRRRDLPPAWSTYLHRGRAAAAAVDRDPGSRSQLELEATTQLVLAGYSEPEAWAAITGAHPTAFTKARSRGRRWWWHTWNRCVHDLDAHLRARRAAAPPPDIAASVVISDAREVLEALWRSWPARTRHTDREVLTVVLDRMDRVGATAVPIPQRDLVLDCAISSRTTVRAALDRLQAAGLITVLPTHVPGTTDTAHTLALPAVLPQPGLASGAVSSTGPTSFQPPLPTSLRRALGLPTHAVLEHLPVAGPSPALAQLAHQAGLLDPGRTEPSPAQRRTLRDYLRRLARHGLAVADEEGSWRATTAPTAVTEELRLTGQAHQDAVQQAITAERAEFRERLDPNARRARWEQQRARALAAAQKAASARQRAWWASLDPTSRDRRRRAAQQAFDDLAPADQANRKHHLARTRARAGEDERHRHQTWLESLTPTELDDRCTVRAHAFARRPAYEQQQLVASWADHRARWRIPHHRRSRPAPVAEAISQANVHQAPSRSAVDAQIGLFDIEALHAS